MKQKKRHSLVPAQVPSWRFFDASKIFTEKTQKFCLFAFFSLSLQR